MLGWRKHKLESRLPRETSTASDMQMITTLMAESEKADLKLDIQKTKIMASGSATSCANRWGNMETVKTLFFGLQSH